MRVQWPSGYVFSLSDAPALDDAATDFTDPAAAYFFESGTRLSGKAVTPFMDGAERQSVAEAGLGFVDGAGGGARAPHTRVFDKPRMRARDEFARLHRVPPLCGHTATALGTESTLR